jgi:hypothetical protein
MRLCRFIECVTYTLSIVRSRSILPRPPPFPQSFKHLPFPVRLPLRCVVQNLTKLFSPVALVDRDPQWFQFLALIRLHRLQVGVPHPSLSFRWKWHVGDLSIDCGSSLGILRTLRPPEMPGRRCTVEHPFATIQYRIFGHPHLLMRGLSGARAKSAWQRWHTPSAHDVRARRNQTDGSRSSGLMRVLTERESEIMSTPTRGVVPSGIYVSFATASFPPLHPSSSCPSFR